MRTRRPCRLLPVGLLAAAALLAAGCVASEKSAYARRLSAVISQGPAATNDVALTFGLDGYAEAPMAARPAPAPGAGPGGS